MVLQTPYWQLGKRHTDKCFWVKHKKKKKEKLPGRPIGKDLSVLE